MLCTLSLCLLFAPQSAEPRTATPQPAARVMRSISVRDWLVGTRKSAPPRLGSLLGLPGATTAEVPLVADAGRGTLDFNALQDLLRQFTPLDWDGGEVQLAGSGATLVITGAAEKVQAVEATLRRLRAAFLHDVRVAVELYRIPERRTFPAVANKEQLDTLVAGLHRVWDAASVGRASRVLTLSKERSTHYVADLGVEVAQQASISDPATAMLFEGARVAVEPHVLTQSKDLVLLCQFAIGEQREALEQRTTGIPDSPSIDVPSLDGCTGTISGRIENGGGLLLAVQGDPGAGPNLLLVVRGTAVGSEAEDIGVYPVSALMTNALRQAVVNAPNQEEPKAFPLQLVAEDRQGRNLGPSDPEDLIAMLQNADGEVDPSSLRTVLGGHLVVAGKPAARETALRLVAGLQEQWLLTARCEVATNLAADQGSVGIFTRVNQPPAPATRVLHEISFPALVGRSHVITRGHETTTTTDVDVEIAQKSVATDPVIDRLFSGLLASFYVYPQQEGYGAEAELDLLHVPDPQRRPRESQEGGDLWLPRTNRARFSHAGLITSGQELLLGEGPNVELGNQAHRSRQSLRITVPHRGSGS